jgi:hypothetical protein
MELLTTFAIGKICENTLNTSIIPT